MAGEPLILKMGVESQFLAIPIACDGRDVHCMPVERDGVKYVFPLELVAHLAIIPYEWMEINMIKAAYGPGDRVIEGGAGIGLVTAHIARVADKVWAYEPLADYAELALRNCNYNAFCGGKAIVISAALGMTMGAMIYHRRYFPSASSGLSNKLYSDGEQEEIQVPMVAIDDEVKRVGANALHLDVEGNEHELLMGMDLSPIRKITMETHPTVIGENNTKQIFDRLETEGLGLVGMAGQRNYPTHNYAACFARTPYHGEIKARLDRKSGAGKGK